MSVLKKYLSQFQKLRRDRKKGGAPHKPILLLSIIDLFEQGEIINQGIFITPELVGRFKSNWSALVKTDHHLIFALPFYHMRSEPFWKLVANPGFGEMIRSKAQIKTLSVLKSAVSHALIDEELSILLSSPESREILKGFLLDTYFPESKSNYLIQRDLFSELASEIAAEDAESYRKKMQKLQAELKNDSFEEEVYVRSGVFKREIANIYNDSCAISGFRIDSTLTVSMIDACHIIPFAESYDDTIPNGIALSPNLHRAFDRGLISISDNYEVLVSKEFSEPNQTNYSIKQFEGKKIQLPNNLKFYPSKENLLHHRKRFDFD